MLCEYDDYGNIPKSQALVDLFVTIDLQRKNETKKMKSRNVLSNINGDVFESIMKKCEKLAEKFEIHKLVAFLLLENQHWNLHSLQDIWFENSLTLLSMIGLKPDSASQDPSLVHPPEGGECLICCDEFEAKDLWCLHCGHVFCTECWKNTITNIISQGQTHIRCQIPKCQCTVPPSSIRELCGPKTYDDLLHFLVDSQVAQSDTLTNCPNKRCARPLSVLDLGVCNVLKCHFCNHEFCTKCRKPHAPATCRERETWRMLTNDEIMEKRIFGEKIKKCPNCQAIIEKNEGCNHMTCMKCRHEFCWKCLKPWKTHPKTYYECAAYIPENDPYMKRPDDINPEFISLYNDVFRERKSKAKAIRENITLQNTLIKLLADSTGNDEASVSESIRQLLDLIRWSNTVLAWSQVRLFMIARRIYEKRKVSYSNQGKEPIIEGNFRLVKYRVEELASATDAAETLIHGVADGRIKKFAPQVVMANIKKITIYKESLLKVCDPHY